MNQRALNNLNSYQKPSQFVKNEMEQGFIEFKDIFDEGRDPIFIIDLESRNIVDVNKAFTEIGSELEKSVEHFKSKLSDDKEIKSIRYRRNKSNFLFNCLYSDNNKAIIQILKFTENLNEELDEETLSLLNSMKDDSIFRTLLDNLPSGLVHTNKKFESIWFNKNFKSLFFREVGNSFNFVDSIYVKDIPEFYRKIEKLNNEGGTINFSFVIQDIRNSKESFISATALRVVEREEIEEGYIFILEDKTEKMHFSEEITKQNLELNQINHELDKFLYSVSHNIRGPVASLEGLLKVIEISDVETVNELKHHLRLNLRLLNGFVNDISNVATNIHTHVINESITLHDLIHKTILFVDNIFEVQPEVAINIPEDYMINSDPDRLGIVLKCLLKNSFQYRDISKEVFKLEINVTQNEEFHLIELKDNGIGIAEKVKPFIFDMFYRGTELSKGNGMGLYNTRETLKKMGGTMNIESKDREWTKAKIYLPIKA